MEKLVGVAGLGDMGGAIAARLVENGYAVIGYDPHPTAGRAALAAAPRGRVAGSPAALAASGAELIISSLPDSAAVRTALCGPDGLVAAVPAATVVVETSTIDPITIQDVAAQCTAHDVELLDVGVGGQPPQARAGGLTFLVGGTEETLARCRPVLSVLAGTIHHTGGVGTAKTVKLVNNLMAMGNTAVAAEAFSLGLRCGMEPRRLFDILATLGGRSHHFTYDFPRIIDDDFSPRFRLALAHKDLSLVGELAEAKDHHTVLTPALLGLFRDAMDRGFADEHFAAVFKVYASPDERRPG